MQNESAIAEIYFNIPPDGRRQLYEWASSADKSTSVELKQRMKKRVATVFGRAISDLVIKQVVSMEVGTEPSKRNIYFGDIVSRLRKERGWSQATLAAKVGMKQAYISKVETGTHQFTFKTVARFAQVFSVNPWDIDPSCPTPGDNLRRIRERSDLSIHDVVELYKKYGLTSFEKLKAMENSEVPMDEIEVGRLASVFGVQQVEIDPMHGFDF